MAKHIIAIDQGTTSSRALVFDERLKAHASAQEEFEQHFPDSGWVEHDVEDIWNTTVSTCRKALAASGLGPGDIAAFGITNQRETTLVWNRETGKAIYRAIVWQDRRTSQTCATLRDKGLEPMITSKTGLLLDPYFSGTKLAWILDNVDGAREAAERGELAFGTVDTFLIWRMTGGKRHVTDATNASRTLLFNIHANDWDDEILELLNIPRGVLPEVLDSAADFGMADASFLGTEIPITGVAGDQQAATVGQACFKPGMMKSTYGTGCFALLNTGAEAVTSKNRLLTTIAYRLNGVPTYALEGSIFIAGAAVQWLRDGLGMIDAAPQSGDLADQADPNQNVILVPAFTGLGAPYWNAECRGAMFGITRGTGPKEFAKAALESVCYQTRDLIEAMHGDWKSTDQGETVLRVDGGMVASDWTMQRLADILDAPVDRPDILETTALGAAYLAGLQIGLYPDLDAFSDSWALERRFSPDSDPMSREKSYSAWKRAVAATLSTAEV